MDARSSLSVSLKRSAAAPETDGGRAAARSNAVTLAAPPGESPTMASRVCISVPYTRSTSPSADSVTWKLLRLIWAPPGTPLQEKTARSDARRAPTLPPRDGSRSVKKAAMRGGPARKRPMLRSAGPGSGATNVRLPSAWTKTRR